MPEKYFEDQFDDEEMKLLFRKHPIMMRKGLILAGIALLVPVLIIFILTFTSKTPTLNQFYFSLFAGFILALLVMFPYWITWYFSVYIVTNQRVIQLSQKGLWKKSMVDIGLDRIQIVSYEIKGIEQTLLGFGTIVIQTYVGELVIHEVSHPRKIQKQLSHILREQGYTQGQTIDSAQNEQ